MRVGGAAQQPDVCVCSCINFGGDDAVPKGLGRALLALGSMYIICTVALVAKRTKGNAVDSTAGD